MKKENQLLSRLLKAVTGKEDIEAKAEDVKAEDAGKQATLTVQLDTSAVQAELEELKTSFEAFKVEANALTAELENQIAQVKAEAEAALQVKEQAIANLIAEKEAMVAEAKAVKLAARKEKVVAAIGTEKAEGLMAATEGLDDAAFEAVVSALAGSVDAEAKTDLFVEKGVSADVDASAVEDKPTHFNTFIKK